MAFVALCFGLLPGFAWLIFYMGEETHAEPKRLIAFTFIAGIAFGFFTVSIETIFNTALSSVGIQELSILSLIGLALIEETMKFAAAHFAVYKTTAIIEPVDVMIYMIVAALGFATLENIGAVVNVTTQTPLVPLLFETISFRFIGATLLHSLTSGILGYHWALGIARGNPKRYLLSGFAIATILHAFFNYLVLNYGNLAYSVIFLIIVGFFLLNDFEKIKIKKI